MNAQLAASIQTIPFLPDNTTAREFVNLQVVSVYNSSGYSYCRWSFKGLFHYQPEEIFDEYDGELICEDRKFDGNFYIKCVEENRKINTTLTILAPLQYSLLPISPQSALLVFVLKLIALKQGLSCVLLVSYKRKFLPASYRSWHLNSTIYSTCHETLQLFVALQKNCNFFSGGFR